MDIFQYRSKWHEISLTYIFLYDLPKMTIVKAIIAMAVAKGWSLHQMDVNNVFLHGDLQEEMYME